MRYYKIHLGRQNSHAGLGIEGGFVGIDFSMPDLSLIGALGEDAREKIRQIYQESHPESTRASVASATGVVFRFINTLEIGDIVLVPMGDGTYRVGKVSSEYFYAGESEPIPHRKKVSWIGTLVRDNFSESLRNAVGAIVALSEVTHHSAEIEALLSGDITRIENSSLNADQAEFALERHLEDFLIENWGNTPFGQDYKLLTNENGDLVSQQYSTDVGYVDILAVRNDNKEILIIELKKGRSGDAVVGQTLRYITAVKKEIAETSQKIRAIILTGKDDQKIRYALEALDGKIEFMVYKISFAIESLM